MDESGIRIDQTVIPISHIYSHVYSLYRRSLTWNQIYDHCSLQDVCTTKRTEQNIIKSHRPTTDECRVSLHLWLACGLIRIPL